MAKKNMNIPKWKYEHFVIQIHRTAYKKHENFIITSFIHDQELLELKPVTQFYVKRKDHGYALIDLFYPQINLAIEIDELHHKNNKLSDYNRQSAVERNLDFYRVEVSKGNIYGQILNLKNKIKEKMKNAKKVGDWTEWSEPKKFFINDLKEKSKKTLFIKIRGEIDPAEYESRQTGFWRIEDRKKDQVSKIIVVHDGVIISVYEDIEWVLSEDKKKKGYNGSKNEDSDFLGAWVTEWSTQQTITYSDDIK